MDIEANYSAVPRVAGRSVSGKIRVGSTAMGQNIICVEPFQAGALIFQIDGVEVTEPTTHTVQLDSTRHVDPLTAVWRLTNHSCSANAIMDVDARELRALRAIAAGEEITFNYLTTEWSMASPFTCQCASQQCHGQIRGFRFLAAADRAALSDQLSVFLCDRMDTYADAESAA